jgi:hypothetical protein
MFTRYRVVCEVNSRTDQEKRIETAVPECSRPNRLCLSATIACISVKCSLTPDKSKPLSTCFRYGSLAYIPPKKHTLSLHSASLITKMHTDKAMRLFHTCSPLKRRVDMEKKMFHSDRSEKTTT